MPRINLLASSPDQAMRIIDEFCNKYAEAKNEFCYKTRLVYEELITNMFKHAVKHQTSFVYVNIEKSNKTVKLNLSYDGEKFDPTTYKDKRINEPFEAKKPGGLGLVLINGFSKKFLYTRKNNMNNIYVEI